MIVKTTGLTLRSWPYSKTSRIVAWLTPGHGRITTLVKGAQRPRSSFMGTMDLFYTCELLYYHRPHTTLYTARECYPLVVRPHLRSDYRAMVAASYYADLAWRFVPPGEPSAALYELLECQLDALASCAPGPAHLCWFELKLLDILGLAPRLTTCLSCRRPVDPREAGQRFSMARGGVICPNCEPGERSDGAVAPVRADVLATLMAWQRSASFHQVRNVRLSKDQQHAMQVLLGRFMEFHLETSLDSRAIALEVLQ